jgi:hypothetical protein
MAHGKFGNVTRRLMVVLVLSKYLQDPFSGPFD